MLKACLWLHAHAFKGYGKMSLHPYAYSGILIWRRTGVHGLASHVIWKHPCSPGIQITQMVNAIWWVKSEVARVLGIRVLDCVCVHVHYFRMNAYHILFCECFAIFACTGIVTIHFSTWLDPLIVLGATTKNPKPALKDVNHQNDLDLPRIEMLIAWCIHVYPLPSEGGFGFDERGASGERSFRETASAGATSDGRW